MHLQNHGRNPVPYHQYRVTLSHVSHQCHGRTSSSDMWCSWGTDIGEILHLKLVGKIAELLVKVDPSYSKFITYENGKTIMYAELSKALYGTLQAAVLFQQDLTAFLTTTLGFTVNPYDWGVINKDINEQQCNIGWHVNDLKISHVDSTVLKQSSNL